MVGLAVDPMAACSVRLVFAFSCNLVLCRSDDRAICCYMGPFNTRIWNTCSKENEMIGDITLQLTIFSIGLVVFTMSMIGGIITMKQIQQHDEERAQLERVPVKIRD